MTIKEYIELYRKFPGFEQYEGWEKDLEKIQEYNKATIEKYPWALPRNRWTGKLAEDYDYSFTELDDMPRGWRIAFGDEMCDEINAELVKAGCENGYRIMQIKEKFGSLRWYDNGATSEVYNIIRKYEKISEKTCIICGAPAECISCDGWISPFCSECASARPAEHFQPIEKE